MKYFKFGTLARRYAAAIFDLAQEGGKIDGVGRELALFGKALNTVPPLLRALEDKEVALKTKLRVVSEIAASLSLSPFVVNSIRLLVEKGRLPLFDAVVSSYQGMAEIVQRMARAKAKIADKELVAAFKERIEKMLSDILKKKTVCETTVDPSLIGGAVVRIGDIAIDASVAGRLQRMKEELLSS